MKKNHLTFVFGVLFCLFFIGCTNNDDEPTPVQQAPQFLDTTFGTNGVVNDADDGFIDACFHSNGKLLLLNAYSLKRYTSSGELDITFGYGGSITFGHCYAKSMGILPNGKIIVGGPSTSNDKDFFLNRFNENGTLDTSFGENGVLYQPAFCTTCFSSLQSILVQNDGKFKVSVSNLNLSTWTPSNSPHYPSYYSGPLSLVIYRYNENGTIDNSHDFIEKTLNTLNFPQGTNNPFYDPNFSVNTKDFFFSELIADENLNKTIVTLSNFSGYSPSGFFSTNNSIFRITNDGSAEDVSFSNTQLGVIKNSNNAAYRLPFLIQNDGNYLVSTKTGLSSPYNNLSFSLTNQGIINNSFGLNGGISVNLGNVNTEVGDIAKQSNGKLLFVGASKSRQSGLVNGPLINDKLFCFRLNANGELDSTFGESGSITIELGERSDKKNMKILVDENNKIYIIYLANGFGACKIYKLNTTN